MAIDLPPIIPPQLSTAERIQAHASAASDVIDTRVAGFAMRISGNRYLTKAQIEKISAASTTPSQAIRALNQAYYQMGHLLVAVYYAPDGENIHVHVVNGRLEGVEGPDVVKAHFRPLVGDADLTVDEFERRRVLAELQAQRMGRDYAISYSVGEDPERFVLVFKGADAADYEPTDFIVEAGNQGNRFLGRYFAGASVEHRLWEGSQLTLGYEGALTQWGETNGGRSYDALNAGFDRATRFGVYGLELNHVQYERDAELETPGQADTSFLCVLLGLCSNILPTTTQVVVESDTTVAALTGEQVLLASTRHRLAFSQRIEAVESEIMLDDGRQVLDEPHTSAEAGLKYFKRSRWFDTDVRWSVQGFVEAGLSSDSGTLGTDDGSSATSAEAVSAGKRTAEYVLYKPKLGLKVAVGEDLSFDIDVLSQISDGNQLPQQQQFVLGGLSTMSAYLPGSLIGDSGVYGRVKLEGLWQPFGAELAPSVFIEYGQAWFEDASGELGDKRTLVDAGVRLEGEIGWGLTTQLVAAVPVSDRNVDSDAIAEMEVDFYWHLEKRF